MPNRLLIKTLSVAHYVPADKGIAQRERWHKAQPNKCPATPKARW